jgi:hypothetical protein
MIEALSPILLANSCKIGAIALHGPHHSAKKSTKTGLSPSISSLKDIFFTMVRSILLLATLQVAQMYSAVLWRCRDQDHNYQK